jgi:hypothetical protein
VLARDYREAACRLSKALSTAIIGRKGGNEMTDRHAGYVITLEENIREDDAEQTIAALKQIKGVLDVCPITADPMLMVAEARVSTQFQKMLHEWIVRSTRVQAPQE